MKHANPNGAGWPVRPALETRPPAPTDPAFSAADQSLGRAAQAERENDPLIGVKLGADLFYGKLVKALQPDPNGVRAELLLAIPAGLAGFACQAATWESLVVGEGHPVYSVFVVFSTTDGGEYPFSDPMNKLLLEDTYSVWSLATAAARSATDAPLPDVEEIVSHVAGTIGTPQFGVPRLPPSSSLGADTLVGAVEAAWPQFLPLLGLVCGMPEEWPLLFAAALQRAMGVVKELIDPVKAYTIAMECAVPMAHLPMKPV